MITKLGMVILKNLQKMKRCRKRKVFHSVCKHSSNTTELMVKKNKVKLIVPSNEKNALTSKISNDEQRNESNFIQKANKANKFREKCAERRKQNGIILLPKSVEDRLYRFKRKLRKENVHPDNIKQIIRNERRKAEQQLKKDLKNSCFRCRQIGHKLSECPLLKDNIENAIDVCFKCGSADHKMSQCKKKFDNLKYAICFICKQKGHITRNCPSNKSGIYPKGGSCKHCGSINHLGRECPENKKQEDDPNKSFISLIDPFTSADAETFDDVVKNCQSKAKIVNF